MEKPTRRARRVNTSIDVKWGFARDCPYAGTIINLTVLGCAIHNKEDIQVEPGQVILVRFWRPQKRILKIEVVHNTLKAEGVQGFGAKFLDLTDEEKDTLEQLVQLFGEPETGKQP
jgi:PilZ domain-containing protein